MTTTIRKQWAATRNPVFAGLATSLLTVGMTASAVAGELVFGDLKSGLGQGIEWQQDDTRLNVKGAFSLGSVWCSGLMKPDTLLGENARQIEVSDDQTTPYLFR